MKTGIFQIALRLLACVLILFPHYALAGAVNIPGFSGGKIVIPPPAPAQPAVKSSAPVNISGFYGSNVTPPPPNTVPGLKDGGTVQGANVTFPSSNQVVIDQTQRQAIIDWKSFDIGSDASVQFNQKGQDQKGNPWVGVALNRIWDSSPSKIYGSLQADGIIYLINQNGILFGPGSRVNVNSLTASALNIKDSDFLNNVLHFTRDNYRLSDDPSAVLDPLATVSNQGELVAANGGYIFLMAPRVDNHGLIDAPAGQVGLVAATDVQLLPPTDTDISRTGYYVIINPTDLNNPLSPDASFGNAVNGVGGELRSDGGMAGMYGSNVDQWGVIRSVTAFQNKKGQVELRAVNKVTTHENSIILLPVDATPDPETGKIPTVSDTFDIKPVVTIAGLQKLDANGNPTESYPVKSIELHGSMVAPTGDVTLSAAEHVNLVDGSSIDVSGVVADLPLPVIADYKLTSVEMRDDYVQKDGVPSGEKITTTATGGSSIGDLSQTILTRDRTALERSIGGARTKNADGSYTTQSGNVNITAANGGITVNQGATIDFSGGAINYSGGYVNTTKLLSGTKIYDISNAPLNVHYDKVIGQYSKTYDRFGVIESFSGMYYGGASPILTHVNSYTQGGDAGTLTLSASTVVLDGKLNGGVTRGVYQNAWTVKGSFKSDDDYQTALSLSVDRGLEAPRAGTLNVNASSISVVSDTAQQTNPDAGQTSQLSAAILNNANLGTLSLNALQTISTANDASLFLQAGGSFYAQARRIDHEGEITVPAGSISMNIVETSFDITNSPIDEKIVLGSNSRLDVSGERVDNTGTAGKNTSALLGYTLTGAGSVKISDQTDAGSGVFIESGAVVDVSGGYIMDQKGKVTGGNAGILNIQGANIMLDGDLRGYALADANGKILGGSITLTSKDIRVGQTSDIWTDFDPITFSSLPDNVIKGRLNLAANRFDDTGFTQITLNSYNNLVIESDTTIAPSLVRLNNPAPAQQTGSSAPVQTQETVGKTLSGRPDLVRLDDSMAIMAGPSSFSFNAGVSFEGVNDLYAGNLKPQDPSQGTITISPGAVIRTTPAASSATRIASDVAANPSPVKTNISLKAPIIDVAGTLESPGGDISIKTTYGNLSIENGAKILANGFNRPDTASTPKGLALNYQPVSGGNITLSAGASNASLILADGSLIDISGSDMVENRMRSADGTFYTFREAGNPGSLSLTYGNNLVWNGTVKAGKAANVIRGAALTVSSTDSSNGMVVKDVDISKYTSIGFDDLTLKSAKSLIFSDGMDKTIGRKLTLDAPVIQGSGQDVTLSAPWIVLTNSNPASPYPQSSTTSNIGDITLSSTGWMDVIGSVQFDGFQNVALKAVRDIRLSESLYIGNAISGKLAATGDLVLDADRIYPGNFYSCKDGSNVIYPDIYSDYTIHANGKVTIKNSHTPVGGPIYSAGGNLTVEGGGGIEVAQGGELAAPLGTITLSAPGQRIYLADGSVLTTAGNTAVNYGAIDSSNIWVTEPKTDPTDVTYKSEYFDNNSLPQKSITLDADTTIAMKGSVIDVSGGGSVFAYKFQPGVEGSVDPLTKANRYIVFKDNGFQMPGTEVYLKGGGGLSEGMYTLLPLDAKNPQNARYAFMPGAYIIEAQTSAVLPVSGSLSQYGYPLTIGFAAVADTSVLGTRPQVYSVRNAADVLKMEGNYVMQSLVSGDAGNISITGNTTIVNGALKASALQGYLGGKVTLIGKNIFVQKEAASELPTDFKFNDDITPYGLTGKLVVSTDGISGQGFREVALGDAGTTDNVTVQSGTILEASIISLAAGKQITLENGSELRALTQRDKDSGEGVINLTTPGTLLVDTDAAVHATHNISLDVNNVDDIRGKLVVDNSAITLKSGNIFFGDGPRMPAEKGLYVTTQVWDRFSGYKDITLVSGSDIQFKDPSLNLSVNGSLTLDAARILGMNSGGTSVTLAASTVNLKNSGSVSTTAALSTAGTFAVNASDQINIGGGDVLLGGFKTVNLNSTNDLSLKGKGSLTTGNADLNITAARVVAASDQNKTKQYIAPNFTVDAGTGAVSMTASGAAAATSSIPGGLLEIKGRKIELATVLQSDGGTIKLTSSGALANDGIFLHEEAGRILAKGTDDAPGGNVTLSTDNGSIALETGSLIDISAGKQLDAGIVTLQAPVGGVAITGDLKGNAGEERDSQGNLVKRGQGGSFILHTNQINDFAALNDKLKAGGFTESIDLRSRLGNIVIANDQVLTARHIKLTADDNDNTKDANNNPLNGNINISGEINASTDKDGGSVELYSNNDLNIDGTILANGTKGGDVLLSSANGWINVNKGTVDVSGGTGGTIYLRALRNSETGNDAKIRLSGTLAGQSSVYAEAFWVYDGAATIDSTAVSNWQTKTGQFMANAGTIKNNILSNGSSLSWFHLLPGIEVRNTGDMTLGTGLDLTSWRYGNEPGVLTIRTANNLTLNQNIVDHPTVVHNTDMNLSAAERLALVGSDSTVRDSWGFNLVAGADMSSADYLAVTKGKTDSTGKPVGDLTIKDNIIVYTESAPIHFASGNDTIIGSGSNAPGYMINASMSYNLASYDGSIQGYVGRDLKIAGGAIQTATGDIDINVGRDLNLSTTGAIRTTGQLSSTDTFGADTLDPPTPIDPTTGKPFAKQAAPTSTGDPKYYETLYWRYAGGGDITLDVGRYVGGWDRNQSSKEWDSFSKMKVTTSTGAIINYGLFSANFGTSATPATAGLATMGGGDLIVHTGGDFLAQAGTFGAGDLAIYSGGDIKGRFLNHGSVNKPGRAEIHAMGNFGAVDQRVQIELFNSRAAVTALGEIQIAAVVNPDLASDQVKAYRANFVNCTYTRDTSISLKAGTDVTIEGNSPFYTTNTGDATVNETVLPATVNVEAGGNIVLLNNFTLASSPTGNLRLVAEKGDISGSYNGTQPASILMSDIAPDYWYGFFTVKGISNETGDQWIDNRAANSSSVPHDHGFYKPEDAAKQATALPLHLNDPQSIEIQSISGDIKDLNLYFPKKAEVTAGRDIVDITYEGQNIDPGDVSKIQAGRNITMAYAKASTKKSTDEQPHEGLIQGGPGVFLVQAGGSIDLGSLKDGIQAIGNGNNPVLGTGKSSLIVLSGYDQNLSEDAVRTFFDELRDAGDLYGMLMAGGKREDAEKLVNTITTKEAKAALDKLRADAESEDAFYKKLTAGGNVQEADALLQDTRSQTIGALTPSGAGDINMTSSQIGTSIGQSDIFIIANGSLNLGKTALPISGATSNTTGITTGGGGAINVFSRLDANVNESRIMTFYGGDITVWTDQGSINAGRGSRTAVSASPAKRVKTSTGGYVYVFTPPAIGSGIRAVKYGDDPLITPGNIHLFAPSGIIDAGEAGIAGGQIILAALRINNAANINFSAGSIGVPQSSTGTANIGTMSGSGIAAQGSQLTSDASGLSAARAQASQLVEDIMTKWLDVKVFDFVLDENDDNNKEDK